MLADPLILPAPGQGWLREGSGGIEQGLLMARNERKTENIVRDELRRLGYDKGGAIVEEQKSDLARLQKLLEHASKQGMGVGKPEFIIRSIDHPDFLVVIECKADQRRQAEVRG
jgi:type I restriction enzyme M protein